jgi:hypothetical protein
MLTQGRSPPLARRLYPALSLRKKKKELTEEEMLALSGGSKGKHTFEFTY